MAPKRTHRSDRKKKEDAKLDAKRSRQEEVEEEVAVEEVDIGQNDDKLHYDIKSR